MSNRIPDRKQTAEIDKIVARFVKKAKRSNKETAFQDASRKGMDAVSDYCRGQGLSTLGFHMIRAELNFMNAEG